MSHCRELKYLLTKELGIVMRGEEIRRLIDAFDTTKVYMYKYGLAGATSFD